MKKKHLGFFRIPFDVHVRGFVVVVPGPFQFCLFSDVQLHLEAQLSVDHWFVGKVGVWLFVSVSRWEVARRFVSRVFDWSS